MTHRVRLYRLGLTPYEAARRWQVERVAEVGDGALEAVALLQHPPVYSFGRRVRPEHLLVDRAALAARGADVVESDRGGDVTFHGPGQVVAYPILDLRRRGLGPVEYVRRLEETMIRALATFDLAGERSPGRPGVWVRGDKIAAVGVRVQRGVTTHGFALNLSTDLTWFDAIVPCGIRDAGVTSMQRVLQSDPGLEIVEAALVSAFEAVFECETILVAAPQAVGFNPRSGEPQDAGFNTRSPELAHASAG